MQGADDMNKFWQLSPFPFWPNSINIWLDYLPFPTLAFYIVTKPCEQKNWRTA